MVAYGSGRRINKNFKASFQFKLSSPDDIRTYWSESPSTIDAGICYTIKLNDTNDGYYFFLLDTNLRYTYILHDFNFFVHSANPFTYPRILQMVNLKCKKGLCYP